MNRINKWGIEPGPKKSRDGQVVVMVAIVTHRSVNGEMKEISPEVVYTDLVMSTENPVTYSMGLEEFKEKYCK